MKILFFNYEYPPLGGGAANATEYIIHQYAKIPDLEVDLITSSVDGQYHLEEISSVIRIHKLPIGKNKNNLHYQTQKDLLVYMWRAYRFSRNLLKNKKYDLTHSFFSVPCGAISWVLFLFYKIPYIISLRGSDVPGYSDRFSVIYKLATFFIRDIWKKSKFVVANSQGLKKLALKTSPQQKIDVIYNGIDTQIFFPAVSQPGGFYITLGGTRITHRKGIRYLIEAVAELFKKYPQIRINIIGEGNEKKELENLIKEKELQDVMRFIGKVSHAEIVKYYQQAKLFVLPSLNEGMSNAMLEAMASGLPIVSTNTGGAEELVEEGRNGFLIKMKDNQDLAEKIETLILDEELRKKMGQASREKAEKMSWEKVAKQYHDLYYKIINS